jgi:hypothetical protein
VQPSAEGAQPVLTAGIDTLGSDVVHSLEVAPANRLNAHIPHQYQSCLQSAVGMKYGHSIALSEHLRGCDLKNPVADFAGNQEHNISNGF